ncbi:unnamed protein product [Soboliphyme baturini]|uniref:Prefoldin subunit 1 n=1 Tax=Soboliphyme baturini TaxID=241478 RepID=A0A183J5N3_9BILA|nr:unnamed protein product [Soboliphyme baturini]
MSLTQHKLRQNDIQIELRHRNILRTKLTVNELLDLPSDTVAYESVGRCFLKQPMENIYGVLQKTIEKSEEEIKNLQSQEDALHRNLKEAEDYLRELVQAKKASVSAD